MHKLRTFVAKNPALQKDLQKIHDNEAGIQKIYEERLKRCMATHKTMEDILESFFIHEMEYNATYETFDVGSHNDPVQDADHKLDYDLAIGVALDEILLEATAAVNLDPKAVKQELGQYIHWRERT
jgi:hypothetical protein